MRKKEKEEQGSNKVSWLYVTEEEPYLRIGFVRVMACATCEILVPLINEFETMS